MSGQPHTGKQLPNIVFMTNHDTGDWLGCYGHDTTASPALCWHPDQEYEQWTKYLHPLT
jgi:hypothetical protein